MYWRDKDSEYKNNDYIRLFTTENQKEYNRLATEFSRQYDAIEESHWQTIDSCVQYALNTGNHMAFVHYITEKARFQKELFCERVNQYYKALQKKCKQKGYKCVAWTDMCILLGDVWRCPDFEYPSERAAVGTLSVWKNKKYLRKLPGKDEIVQICFYLQLGSKETNELLYLAGHDTLYSVDMVDVIEWYYLDYFIKKQMYEPEDGIELQAKMCGLLGKVKNAINKSLKEGKSGERENIIFLDKENKRTVKVFASKKPIGQEIEKDIQKYRILLEQAGYEHKESQLRDEDYLTVILGRELESCEKDETQFQEFSQSARPFTFIKKRYGFTFMTKRFAENYEMYKKNLYYTTTPLDISADAEQLIRLNHRVFINTFCEDFYKKVSETQGKQRSDVQKNPINQMTYTALNEIWNIQNILYAEDEENNPLYSEERACGARSPVASLIKGRNLLQDRGAYYSFKDTDKNQTITSAYIYENDKKKKSNAIKFCLCTGAEDYLADYLIKAGVWMENLLEAEEEGTLEKTDSLIIYAIKYRDALLNKWMEKWKDKNPIKSASGMEKLLKDNFPLIRLLMTINREIQLVLKDVLVEDEEVIKYYLNAVLIFPVKSCKKPWFEGTQEYIDKRTKYVDRTKEQSSLETGRREKWK